MNSVVIETFDVSSRNSGTIYKPIRTRTLKDHELIDEQDKMLRAYGWPVRAASGVFVYLDEKNGLVHVQKLVDEP